MKKCLLRLLSVYFLLILIDAQIANCMERAFSQTEHNECVREEKAIKIIEKYENELLSALKIISRLSKMSNLEHMYVEQDITIVKELADTTICKSLIKILRVGEFLQAADHILITSMSIINERSSNSTQAIVLLKTAMKIVKTTLSMLKHEDHAVILWLTECRVPMKNSDNSLFTENSTEEIKTGPENLDAIHDSVSIYSASFQSEMVASYVLSQIGSLDSANPDNQTTTQDASQTHSEHESDQSATNPFLTTVL